jgi:hypothetical protein
VVLTFRVVQCLHSIASSIIETRFPGANPRAPHARSLESSSSGSKYTVRARTQPGGAPSFPGYKSHEQRLQAFQDEFADVYRRIDSNGDQREEVERNRGGRYVSEYSHTWCRAPWMDVRWIANL